MIGRQSVWSKPEIQVLLRRFVACADEVWRLQNRQGPDCALFRGFADKGHYAGRPGTRQGIYAATPAGELLASCNSNNPAVVGRMMQDALARWSAIPPARRYLAQDPARQAVDRRNAKCPRDGLILRVTSRDLPRRKKLPGWRGKAWNFDFAWFRKAEARALLPARLQRGERHAAPRALVERLARLHLLDNVRGQTTPYAAGEIRQAELSCTVQELRGDVARLRLAGRTHAEANGRGVALRLLGRAEFDTRKQAFLHFELVAVGERWGATRYNFRNGDEERAPIGFLLQRSGEKPQQRVAPEHFYDYGW